MRILKSLYLKYLAWKKPLQYARAIGVNLGNNTKIVSCKTGMFGSEPYLIKIGDDCLISGQVQFLTHDGSLNIFRKEIPNAFIYKRVVIGNNVFIGYRTILMPGVTVGDNVAIGAGSIITKNIPSNCVVAGVPAKVLKTYEEYRDKMIPQMDLIDGMNGEVKEVYLKEKFNLS